MEKRNTGTDLRGFLKELGFSDTEVDVYLGLLKYGSCSITELSRKAGLKRTTVYSNIGNLKGNGLISETRDGAKKLLVAEDPSLINDLINRRRERFESIVADSHWMIKDLKNSFSKGSRRDEVAVRYYEGRRSVKNLYYEVLKSDEIKSYVNLEKVLSIFPENAELFAKAHAKNRKMKIWEIIEESDAAREYVERYVKTDFSRYFYKLIPTAIGMPSIDIMMYEDKIAIIDFDKVLSGIVIRSRNYFKNSSAIFDFLWGMIPQ